MKKLLSAILCGAAGWVSAQTPSALPQSSKLHSSSSHHSLGLTLGYFSPTLSGSGLQDFDISDASLYGLKSLDSNSKESRYRVPLSTKLKEPVRMHGFSVGYRWDYLKNFQGGMDFSFAWARDKHTVVQLSTYLNPTLYHQGKWRFQLHTGTGVSFTTITLTNMQPLAGYHPYFREASMDLKPGSSISISNHQWFLSGGLQTEYEIAKGVKAFGNLSVNRTLAYGKMSVTSAAEDSHLDYGSIYVVQPNERSDQRHNVNAKFNHTGVQFKIGLFFDFGDAQDEVKRCECCGQIIEE